MTTIGTFKKKQGISVAEREMSDPRLIRTFGGSNQPSSPTTANADEPPAKRQRLDVETRRDDLLQMNIDQLITSAEETDEVADAKRALIGRITRDPRYQFFVDVVGASGRGGPIDPMTVFDTTNVRALLTELSEKIARLSQGRTLVNTLTREMQRIISERPRLEQEKLTTRLRFAEVQTKSQDILRKRRQRVVALQDQTRRLLELKRVGQPAIMWWEKLVDQIRARELLGSSQPATKGTRKPQAGSLGAFVTSLAGSQKSESYTAHVSEIVQEFIKLIAAEPGVMWLQTLNVEAFHKTPLGIKILGIYSRQFNVPVQSIREDDRPMAIAEVMLDLVMGFIMPAAPTLDHPDLFISTPFPLFMDYKIFAFTLNEPFRSAIGTKGSDELVKLMPFLVQTYSQLYEKLTLNGVDERNKFALLFELYKQVPLNPRPRTRTSQTSPPSPSPPTPTPQGEQAVGQTFTPPVGTVPKRRASTTQVKNQKPSGNTTIDESGTEEPDEPSRLGFPRSMGKLAGTNTAKQKAAQNLREARDPRYSERLEAVVPNARQLFPWIQAFEGVAELGYDDKIEEAAMDFTIFAHCLQEALLRLIDVDSPSRRSRKILEAYLAPIPQAAHLKFLKDVVANVAILIDDNVLYLKPTKNNPQPTATDIRQTQLQALTETQLCEALLRDIVAWSRELEPNDVEPIVSVPSAWLNHHRKTGQGITIAEFIRAWHADMATLTGREANNSQLIPRAEWNWPRHSASTTPGKGDPDYTNPSISDSISFGDTFGKFVNIKKERDQEVTDYQTRIGGLIASGGNPDSVFNKVAVASHLIDPYVDFINQNSAEEIAKTSKEIEELEEQLASVTRSQAASGASDEDEQDDDDDDDDMGMIVPPGGSTNRSTPRGRNNAYSNDIEIKLEQVNEFVEKTRARIESLKRSINTSPLIPLTNMSVAISQSFAYLRSKQGGQSWCEIVRSPDNLIVSRNEEARRLFATLVRDHMTNSEQRSGARALYQQRTYYDVVFIDKSVVAERLLSIPAEVAGNGGTFYRFRF